jgi:hypothetical protein
MSEIFDEFLSERPLSYSDEGAFHMPSLEDAEMAHQKKN